jgi:dephospho-CoA kinase
MMPTRGRVVLAQTGLIVGIGGLQRSGKDSLAELFAREGCYCVSLGDIVRETARQRHQHKADPISLANTTETSNWLRESRGADVVLRAALDRYKSALETQSFRALVLFSVRAPVEVDFILNHGGELVWVEASEEIRYARALKHLRLGDSPFDAEELRRQEAAQWQPKSGIPIEAQMDLSYVKEKATRLLLNEGDDWATFYVDAQRLIQEVLRDH